MGKRLLTVLAASVLLVLPASVATADPACTVFGTSARDVWFVLPGVPGDTIPIDAHAVVCGGAGNDQITGGPDFEGTFYGGDGKDWVSGLAGTGTFKGGQGDDGVGDLNGGRFEGGPGDDIVYRLNGGMFDGGQGIDGVSTLSDGTFKGGQDDDEVTCANGGTFDAGKGSDTVWNLVSTVLISVETVENEGVLCY